MNIKAIGWCIVAASTLMSFASSRAHAYSFIVEEPRDYGSGDCNTTLGSRGDRTYPIRDGLSGLGWAGAWYINGDAWPQDWIDHAYSGYSDGIDHMYGDANHLTIFSGHGNSGSLAFSHSHTEAGVTRCNAGGTSDPNGIVLGIASGAVSANMIAISCCFLNPNTIADVYEDGLTQIMAYGGESYSDATMVQNFWNRLASQHNVGAWLDAMEVRTGGGYNSSAVFTNGWNQTDLDWNWNNCNVRSQNCATSRNYDRTSIYYYDWRDHGCSGCSSC